MLDLSLPVQISGKDGYYMDQQDMVCKSCGPSGLPMETFSSWPLIVMYLLLAVVFVYIVRRMRFCSKVEVGVGAGDRVIVSVPRPHREESGTIMTAGTDTLDVLMDDGDKAYEVQKGNVKDGQAVGQVSERVTLCFEVDDAAANGVVVADNGDGTFQIEYTEGGGTFPNA